ncbi:MAG: zinc ABC transporter solute-binding protein [Gaiellales bacterium]|nr:zinc ABC transporter solute-binding protein [Gaiellales bacterium]
MSGPVHRGVCVTLLVGLLLVVAVGGCGGGQEAPGPESGPEPSVLAVESFLADIAQNVAGDRLKVDVLLPSGVDPHSFQPSPADAGRVSVAHVVIVNGAGLEAFLADLMNASGSQARVVEASAGLQPRLSRWGDEAGESDPHFWLDPVMVKTYVDNIRDGLAAADPAGAAEYERNAAAYQVELDELNAWIVSQVQRVPSGRRLLVTNHENLGYFADRYGFQLVGTLLAGVSSGASPSAQDLAKLEDDIRRLGVPAVILETGADPKLAQQVAQDTGARVVTEVHTHALGPAGGSADTYLDMMRHNVTVIVDALR